MEAFLQDGLKIFIWVVIIALGVGFFGGMLIDNDDFDGAKNNSSKESNDTYQKNEKKERKKTFQGTQMHCSSCGSSFPEHKLVYRNDNDRDDDWQDDWEERRQKQERNGREKCCPICYSDSVHYA